MRAFWFAVLGLLPALALGGPSARAQPSGAADPDLPLREGCSNIKLKDGVVSAFCRDRRGQWRAATLDLVRCQPGGGIWNRDGTLICEPRLGGPAPPGAN